MNETKNNKLQGSEKEIYKVNIIPQGNKLCKDLLKELLIQVSRMD